MSEPLFTVVDEHDDPIGAKKKKYITSDELYRVSVLWITNNARQSLLAQRAFTKSHDPGVWGPAVAGTVEQGETYETNIIKEAEEEIGVKNTPFQFGFKTRIHGRHNYFVNYFFTTLDWPISAFRPRPGEVEQVKWFTNEEIINILRYSPTQLTPSMAQYFPKVLKIINDS